MDDRPRCIIINADDFGFAPGLTAGIVKAAREGIVTSTTITANMSAASEAVGMLPQIPHVGVGVHLNFCQGPPLAARASVLADEDGVMRRKATQLFKACLKRGVLDAIEAEADAQVAWMLDHDVRPTHLDSHRHVHAFWPIFRRVARVARRYDIRLIRLPLEHLPPGPWPRPAPGGNNVRRLLNFFAAGCRRIAPEMFATDGAWGIAHTGAISPEFLKTAARLAPPGVTEIVTHPGLAEGLDESVTRLIWQRQAELDALCEPDVRRAFEQNGIKLIHYGQIGT